MLITKDTSYLTQYAAIVGGIEQALASVRADIPADELVDQLRTDILALLIDTHPTPEELVRRAEALTVCRYCVYWSIEQTRAYMQDAMNKRQRITLADFAAHIAEANDQSGCPDAFLPMAKYYWTLCGMVQVNIHAGGMPMVRTALRAEVALNLV